MPTAPTARFTIRGRDPVAIEVSGDFVASAVVGFDAVIRCVVGDGDITIDLTACDTVDAAALEAVVQAEGLVRRAGGAASVLRKRESLHV